MIFLLILVFGFIVLCFPAVRCIIFHPLLTIYYGCRDLFFYFLHRKWNEASFGQILCYIANGSTSFGCGKTLSASNYVVSLYKRHDGKKVWCNRRKKFVTQRIKVISNIDFLTIPYEQLVSLAQFVQWTDKVTEVDDLNDTLTVTYMVIDEASSQLNSRDFKSNFDAYFLSRLLTTRHARASIILTSQRSGMVDKLMRDCTHLYIGCDKLWRLQRLNYYDAYEIENAQSPSLVKPIQRRCWFVKDSAFANYDTYACVQSLRKSCERGDMLSESEILTLQMGQPVNMDVVEHPTRKWIRSQRKRRK